MRVWGVLLCLALAACGKASDKAADKAAEAVRLEPATFDGSNYKTTAEKITHGRRLANVLGCTGCHGADLHGSNVSADDPGFGDMNAPNLTLLIPTYSDAEFTRVIREGVPKDGRVMWFMPSQNLQFLSDGDLAAVLAYLRSVPAGGKPMPPLRRGPGFEKAVQKGDMVPATQLVARFRAEAPVDLGPAHAQGRKIARAVCSECHDSQLQGHAGFSPNLIVASGYTDADFDRLLATGKGVGDRDLGLMSLIAKTHLSYLTPAERKAVLGYLHARADAAPAS